MRESSWGSSVLAFLMSVMVAFFVVSCSDENVCDPGALQRCPCAGGDDATQVCADDGLRWEACECGSGDGDADVDVDADADADADSVETDADAEGDTETLDLLERQEVVDIVVEEILPGEVPEGVPYRCVFATERGGPLAEGSVIADSYMDEGNVEVTLEEPSYLFFLDLAPGALYGHPTKFIIVSETGQRQVHESLWMPAVDTAIPTAIMRDLEDEADVVDSNFEPQPPAGEYTEFIGDIMPASSVMEGFLLVEGFVENPQSDNIVGSLAQYVHGSTVMGESVFGNYMNSYSSLRRYNVNFDNFAYGSSPHLWSYLSRFDDEGRGVITIVIASVGYPEHVMLYNPYCPWPWGASEPDCYPTTMSSTQMADGLATFEDTQFNILLGMSYSGTFVDNLSALPNVRVVATATSGMGPAYIDYDHLEGQDDENPQDYGTEWLSSIYFSTWNIVQDPDAMDAIEYAARTQDVPVTSMLLCAAAERAVGGLTELLPRRDYDLTHRRGYTNPQRYCSFELDF